MDINRGNVNHILEIIRSYFLRVNPGLCQVKRINALPEKRESVLVAISPIMIVGFFPPSSKFISKEGF